jgi:hypothetical protein
MRLLIKFNLGIFLFITTSVFAQNLNTNNLIIPEKADSGEIFELKRGDILVKPNHNWFPGTEWVLYGNNFGHVAIVLKGGKNNNIEQLLTETELFESHSRNVPEEFQIRKIPGFVGGTDYRYANDSFDKKYTGKRYRLRLNIPESSIDSVLQYILEQDMDESTWRTIKNTSNVEKDKHYWYCSLLIYQAFKDVLNIDLDSNGGLIVFPNDIVAHPLFDHKNGRVVF